LIDPYTNKYLLTWSATDACGNSSTASIVLEVFQTNLECFKGVYIPNIFSPNGDGINDEFQPFIEALFNSYHFVIYDRWGEFVFESFSYGESWKGYFRNRPSSQGVYAYSLTFKLNNGKVKHYLGDVTILY
jgi:gliding motility-associated-like protein